MNDETLNFSISNVEYIEKTNDSLFRKMRIRAFASGDNVHTLPISVDILKECAYSIYDKPIVWKYNRFYNDATTHDIEEVPVGFIKECEDNPIVFEEEDGKVFLTIDALIWTKYCGNLIEIFERDNKVKDVSIEISALQDEIPLCDKPNVKGFCVAGITILGELFNPAVKGCKATLLEFAVDKENYLNEIEFAENSIAINNTKEASVNGKWANPRRKLFNPISKASNSKALFKEAYLITDFSTEEPEITKFKYPHHVIRNGELVLHRDGVIAAFQRASQQGIVTGSVKTHILRHYRELGLSTENFAEFNMSAEDFSFYFKDYMNAESGCKINMAENIDNKDEKIVEINNSEDTENKSEEKETTENFECKNEEFSDEKPEGEGETDKEEPKNEETENKEFADNETENPDNEKPEIDDDKDIDDDNKEEKQDMSIEMAKSEIQKMSEEIATLKQENDVYMSKLETMSDYEDLKKFRDDTIEKNKREEQLSEMNQVFCEISEKGYTFSDTDRKDLISKYETFSSIDSWKNFVKAMVFDKADTTGVVKIGLPYANTESKSIWDRV